MRNPPLVAAEDLNPGDFVVIDPVLRKARKMRDGSETPIGFAPWYIRAGDLFVPPATSDELQKMHEDLF